MLDLEWSIAYFITGHALSISLYFVFNCVACMPYCRVSNRYQHHSAAPMNRQKSWQPIPKLQLFYKPSASNTSFQTTTTPNHLRRPDPDLPLHHLSSLTLPHLKPPIQPQQWSSSKKSSTSRSSQSSQAPRKNPTGSPTLVRPPFSLSIFSTY